MLEDTHSKWFEILRTSWNILIVLLPRTEQPLSLLLSSLLFSFSSLPLLFSSVLFSFLLFSFRLLYFLVFSFLLLSSLIVSFAVSHFCFALILSSLIGSKHWNRYLCTLVDMLRIKPYWRSWGNSQEGMKPSSRILGVFWKDRRMHRCTICKALDWDPQAPREIPDGCQIVPGRTGRLLAYRYQEDEIKATSLCAKSNSRCAR